MERLFVRGTFIAGCMVMLVALANGITTPFSQQAQVSTYPPASTQTTTSDTTSTDDTSGDGSTQPSYTTTVSADSPSVTTTGTSHVTDTTTTETTSTLASEYPACPFTPTGTQMLVDFTEKGTVPLSSLTIRANGPVSDAMRIRTISLPSGYYKLWLAGTAPVLDTVYDKQSWYFILEDSAQRVLAKSEPTPDMQSGTYVYRDTTARSISVNAYAVHAVVRHAAYSASLAHPVAPLCALLERTDTATQQTTQTKNTSLSGEYTHTVSTTSVAQENTLTPLAPQPPLHLTCPFSAREGRTIIDFTQGGVVSVADLSLVASGTRAQAQRAMKALLVSGAYDVRLASYASHGSLAQVWYAELLDASGGSVRTPSSTDVPDWETTFATRVASSFAVPHSMVYVRAVHAAYPADLAHTVAPLCAAFDMISPVMEEQIPLVQNTTPPSAFTAPPTEAPVPVVAPSRQLQNSTLPGGTVTTKTTVRTTPTPAPTLPTNTMTTNSVEMVAAEPGSIGIESALREVQVSSETYAARKMIATHATDTPFTLLQSAGSKERVALAVELLQTEKRIHDPKREDASSSAALLERMLTRTITESTSSEEGPLIERQRASLKVRNGLVASRDTDGDGVSDYDEEELYKTDPDNPFTGGGVLTDGERILLGLDPRTNEPRAVDTLSPKHTPAPAESYFSLEHVTYASSTSPDNSSRGIRLSGKSKPYSFVTIYVYSTPVVVTVRTDRAGHFEYTLDTTLEDGTHEIYLATVNNSGKILAQSEPLMFTKTAEAVTYVPPLASPASDPVDESARLMMALGLIIFMLLSFSVVVWFGIQARSAHPSE